MFNQLVTEVAGSARAFARATALSAAGIVFAIVGLGFLTCALWLLLVTLESALFAASVIGGLYCAVGFILLAIGSSRRNNTPYRQDIYADKYQPREPFLQMAEGFAMGMQAGRSARNGRG